jgi:succinate dehydrogenase/fumarate reductase cytochrome b subunit
MLLYVNSVVFLSALAQAITSIGMAYFSPPAWMFDLHRINGAILLITALVHLILNWTWIKTNVLKLKKKT